MSTYSDIRTKIADNLNTITGLRTYDYIPDNIAPPCAIIKPSRTEFDTTFGRAADTVTVDVMVVVQRGNERTGQNLLDTYCDAAGTASVKAAIEAAPTLGGAVNDLRVTEISSYGAVDIGETTYLQATFVVNVIV